jgi:hypothetical protein
MGVDGVFTDFPEDANKAINWGSTLPLIIFGAIGLLFLCCSFLIIFVIFCGLNLIFCFSKKKNEFVEIDDEIKQINKNKYY